MAGMTKAVKKQAKKVATMNVRLTPDTAERLQRFEVGAQELKAAAASIHESAKITAASHADPGEKRLHRRVRVLVYDAVGTRISNASYDLAKSDELSVTLSDDAGLSATIASVDR
jgi:hypothetical protein